MVRSARGALGKRRGTTPVKPCCTGSPPCAATMQSSPATSTTCPSAWPSRSHSATSTPSASAAPLVYQATPTPCFSGERS